MSFLFFVSLISSTWLSGISPRFLSPSPESGREDLEEFSTAERIKFGLLLRGVWSVSLVSRSAYFMEPHLSRTAQESSDSPLSRLPRIGISRLPFISTIVRPASASAIYVWFMRAIVESATEINYVAVVSSACTPLWELGAQPKRKRGNNGR